MKIESKMAVSLTKEHEYKLFYGAVKVSDEFEDFEKEPLIHLEFQVPDDRKNISATPAICLTERETHELIAMLGRSVERLSIRNYEKSQKNIPQMKSMFGYMQNTMTEDAALRSPAMTCGYYTSAPLAQGVLGAEVEAKIRMMEDMESGNKL